MTIDAREIYYVDKDGNERSLDEVLDYIADKIKDYDSIVETEIDFKKRMIRLMNKDIDNGNDNACK